MKKIILFLVIALPLIYVGWGVFSSKAEQLSTLQTAELKRGDLLISVSATGTLEPVELVDVGAQVAGQVVSLGLDQAGKTIDYGSVVTEGSKLAEIDPAIYEIEVLQAQAQLARAEADAGQARAKLNQTEQDWKRAQRLGSSSALSQSAYDAYQATYEIARAGVAVADAAITQAQASLSRAKRNLTYTTILSPVTGVIIDRRVNIGQTVVSSLNAPSLFLIARDLTHMQVWVAVNEADIGSIKHGQKVTFTVDTYPGEVFEGSVAKVRLNATMTQNVVTYTVEVDTENQSGRLLPYLTANVRFEIMEVKDVLLVPNSALRFTPGSEKVFPEYQGLLQMDNNQKTPGSLPAEGKGRSKPGHALSSDNQEKTVWILGSDTQPESGLLRPLQVKVGNSDGVFTEVISTSLREGMTVATGIRAEDSAKKVSNPFAPQMPSRSRRN